MGDTITSTVAFRSNLQPVNGSYGADQHFLSTIRDPFALEIMCKAGYGTTPVQKQIYNDASVHCTYALPGDYPYGTIIDNSTGEARGVCKCTNINCHRFSTCRPDFDSLELEAAEKNIYFQEKVQEILIAAKEEPAELTDLLQEGDPQAAAALYAASPSSTVENKTVSIAPAVPAAPVKYLSVKNEAPMVKSPAVQDATFDSFTNVPQDEIIKLDPVERTIVNAGPGTGKTWTLIEKIKYMLTESETDPENILVLCFSRAAVEVVRNRLEHAAKAEELPQNWHEVEVRTFDSFATYLLAWSRENRPDILPPCYTLESESYDQRIQTATSVIQKITDLLAGYKHIIVDEVQDLVGVRAEMVLSLLKNLPDTCGFTLLGDFCQALYDYLAINDSNVIDSQKFYHSIFHTYCNARYFALTHNYRQGDELGAFTIPYRQSILTGDASTRTKEAKKLNAELLTSKVNLQRFSENDAVMLKKAGTLGILTRTNGQALQISSWLRTEGIEHTLQKPAESHALASWIAKTLTNAETDVIDGTEFSDLFSAAYPARTSDANRYWNALISTQIDGTKRHYEIEDILRGLLQNPRDPLLYEDPCNDSDDIVVSNIHRAKGREFDTVLIVNDVLDAMADDETNDLLEHKVCYVALTRPKKEIEKVVLKPQYIYISHDETRRCFRSGGFGKKKYLSHFEVGDSSDLSARSFARDTMIQKYIQRMPQDSRLKLLKCSDEIEPYVIYSIVPEEDEHTVLGYTSAAFSRSMEKSIQRIYSNNSTIAHKYYPGIFRDIYFDGLNTCISSSDAGIPGAKKIGGMYVWYGLEISGFAQIEKDRY